MKYNKSSRIDALSIEEDRVTINTCIWPTYSQNHCPIPTWFDTSGPLPPKQPLWVQCTLHIRWNMSYLNNPRWPSGRQLGDGTHTDSDVTDWDVYHDFTWMWYKGTIQSVGQRKKSMWCPCSFEQYIIEWFCISAMFAIMHTGIKCNIQKQSSCFIFIQITTLAPKVWWLYHPSELQTMTIVLSCVSPIRVMDNDGCQPSFSAHSAA